MQPIDRPLGNVFCHALDAIVAMKSGSTQDRWRRAAIAAAGHQHLNHQRPDAGGAPPLTLVSFRGFVPLASTIHNWPLAM